MASLKSFITKAYQVLRSGGSSGVGASFTSTSSSNIPEDSTENTERLLTDLKPLTDSMHLLNADNVDLHGIVESTPVRPHKPPITFIDVVSNSVMTAVMIVLRPGQGIPLHDHPGMLGIIKVLHGEIKVTSYSIVPGEKLKNHVVPVTRMPDLIMSNLSYPQVLTPDSRNIHKIEYVSGEGEHDYAAFLDVLSPPYEDHVGCHYYQVERYHPLDPRSKMKKEDGDSSNCNLVEVRCPKDYHTQTVVLQ